MSNSGIRMLCDKHQINIRMDGRKIPWLVEKLNDNGFKIEYKALVQLLNNRSDWRLIYAVGMCQIFQAKIGDLFYFEDDQGLRVDIDFI